MPPATAAGTPAHHDVDVDMEPVRSLDSVANALSPQRIAEVPGTQRPPKPEPMAMLLKM